MKSGGQNFKIAGSSTFVDNKYFIKHEAMKNEYCLNSPSIFLRQERLMPKLKGYKVSSRSENEIENTLFKFETK